jgi:hypothetical protein
MKESNLLLYLDEILEESEKIKQLKKKLLKVQTTDKKDEILGEMNAAIFHLKTHCNLLDEDLEQIHSWSELEKG